MSTCEHVSSACSGQVNFGSAHQGRQASCWAISLLAAVLLVVPLATAQEYRQLSTDIELQPQLVIPPPKLGFQPGLLDLWLLALDAPDSDVRRRVCESLAAAHRLGLPDTQRAVAGLVQLLERGDDQRDVQVAAAKALIALDARDTAEKLFSQLKPNDLGLAQLVEPALGRWQFQPIADVWLTRLQQSYTPRRYMLMAIHGLAELNESRAAEPLRKLVESDSLTADLRLAAAQSLGRLQHEGLVDLAAELADKPGKPGRLSRILAAYLLLHHNDAATRRVLGQLAQDKDPAVASVALQRWYELAPLEVIGIAPQLLASSDGNLRHQATVAIASQPSQENAELLLTRLVDPIPDIRIVARQALLKFAEDPALRARVLKGIDEVIAGDDWRGLEQAARLAGDLEHQPVATRLVELLRHPRDEVGVTAAWSIRQLENREILPQLVEFCNVATDFAFGQGTVEVPGYIDLRVCQLLALFGTLKYEPADSLLRRYIPKTAIMADSRAAAIWSLGHLHAEQAPAELGALLAARVSDIGTPPETMDVRRHAAMALGRMKNEDQLPTLREFYKSDTSNRPVGYACGWAIEQLTGEKVQPPEQTIFYQQGWFLVPVSSQE